MHFSSKDDILDLIENTEALETLLNSFVFESTHCRWEQCKDVQRCPQSVCLETSWHNSITWRQDIADYLGNSLTPTERMNLVGGKAGARVWRGMNRLTFRQSVKWKSENGGFDNFDRHCDIMRQIVTWNLESWALFFCRECWNSIVALVWFFHFKIFYTLSGSKWYPGLGLCYR